MIVFSIGKLKLCFHWSFFLLLGLVAAAPDHALIVMGLAASLCHELGHLAVMQLLDISPSGLSFTMFGGKLQGSRYPSFSAELAALFGGAGTNLALALCFGFSSNHQLQLFSAVNLVLGGFNLLPVQGLDGGSIVFLALEQIVGTFRAQRISTPLSAGVLTALWMWAFSLWKKHPQLPALLGIPLLCSMVFACQKYKK